MSANESIVGKAGDARASADNSKVCLPTIAVASLLTASNFGLLVYSVLNRGDQRFESVGFSFEFAASLLLILVGILTFRVARKVRLDSVFVCFAALALFTLFNVLTHFLIHGDPRRSVTLIGILLVFFAAYIMGRNSLSLLSFQLSRLLWVFPFVTLLFLLWFYIDARLEFPFGILRPQIRGGVRSTELSLIAGLQLVYCFFVMNQIRQRNSFVRGANAVFAWLAVVMILWFASIAAIGTLLALYMLYQALAGQFFARTVKALLAGAVLVLATSMALDMNIADVFVTQVSEKVAALEEGEAGSRTAIYAELLVLATGSPVFGVGLGSFSQISTTGWLGRATHPHQNILGIAAETGVLSALMYVTFVVAVVYVGIRTLRILTARHGLVPTYALPIALLAFGAFLYLQLRGLAQDTWQMKEVYLWAGIVVGCYSHCRRWRELPLSGRTNQYRLNVCGSEKE